MNQLTTFAKTTLGTVLCTLIAVYLLEGYAAPKGAPKGSSVPLRGLKDALFPKTV